MGDRRVRDAVADLAAALMSDQEYRTAIEFDVLGRPEPPYADRRCVFIGVSPNSRPGKAVPLWHVSAGVE